MSTIFTARHTNNQRGFTLIEVLLTGAILAFGIVSIYESLFISVDAHGYYAHYLSAHEWVNEKIWDVQSDLIDKGGLDDVQSSGSFVRDHKQYDWTMMISLMDEQQKLYRVHVVLSWKEGPKRVHTDRDTYLMSPELKNYEESTA